MTFTFKVVNSAVKQMTRLLCVVHGDQIVRIPERGPLILVANHINFIEVPLVFTHLLPRPVTGFAKAETWNNPAMGALFNLWGAIPLQRGSADTQAIRSALEALKAGKILAVAPEGTRSGHGRLSRGYPGVVTLALHSQAPLLPIGYYGNEQLRSNLVKLRRTNFHIVVGYPFFLNPGSTKITREIRQEMTDQIMYQLAALLPDNYRGEYADLSNARETFLHFPEGSQSNLLLGPYQQVK